MTMRFLGNETSHSLRGRNLEQDECTKFAAINTTFNSDTRVPTYTGIMFEIYPRMDLELLTIELDVRIPASVANPDLSVEVYTMLGSFELMEAYDSSRWTLVTSTEAVLLPDGSGAIIPTHEFNALPIKMAERRSFYITMKESYLDHNVMALDKTGELQMRTPELDILVGVGLNEYKFPGDYDRTLDPQFAGVLHVRRTSDCSVQASQTTMEYAFLMDQEPTTEVFEELSRHLDDAIKILMQENAVLLNYRKAYDLELSGPAKSGRSPYPGTCPDDWSICPENYLRGTITFSHLESLYSGTLEYELYRSVDTVTEFIREQFVDQNVNYIGRHSVSADVSLVLNGNPSGEKMDDIQLDYLSDVTSDFLNDKADSTLTIFRVDFTKQSLQNARAIRRSRNLRSDSIKVEGKILGAQTNQFAYDNFSDEIEDTFRLSQGVFLESLEANGLRPSAITDDDRIEYFTSISSVRAKVGVDETAQADLPETMLPSNSSQLFLAVLLAAVAAVLCVAAFLFVKHRDKQAEKKRDREEMRKLRNMRDTKDRQKLRRENSGDGTCEILTMKDEVSVISSQSSPHKSVDGIRSEDSGCEQTYDGQVYTEEESEQPESGPTCEPQTQYAIGNYSCPKKPLTPRRTRSFDQQYGADSSPGFTPSSGPSRLQHTPPRRTPPQRSVSEQEHFRGGPGGRSPQGYCHYPQTPGSGYSRPFVGRSQSFDGTDNWVHQSPGQWRTGPYGVYPSPGRGRGLPSHSLSHNGAFAQSPGQWRASPRRGYPSPGRGPPSRSRSFDVSGGQSPGQWRPGQHGVSPGRGYPSPGRGAPRRSPSFDAAGVNGPGQWRPGAVGGPPGHHFPSLGPRVTAGRIPPDRSQSFNGAVGQGRGQMNPVPSGASPGRGCQSRGRGPPSRSQSFDGHWQPGPNGASPGCYYPSPGFYYPSPGRGASRSPSFDSALGQAPVRYGAKRFPPRTPQGQYTHHGLPPQSPGSVSNRSMPSSYSMDHGAPSNPQGTSPDAPYQRSRSIDHTGLTDTEPTFLPDISDQAQPQFPQETNPSQPPPIPATPTSRQSMPVDGAESSDDLAPAGAQAPPKGSEQDSTSPRTPENGKQMAQSKSLGGAEFPGENGSAEVEGCQQPSPLTSTNHHNSPFSRLDGRPAASNAVIDDLRSFGTVESREFRLDDSDSYDCDHSAVLFQGVNPSSPDDDGSIGEVRINEIERIMGDCKNESIEQVDCEYEDSEMVDSRENYCEVVWTRGGAKEYEEQVGIETACNENKVQKKKKKLKKHKKKHHMKPGEKPKST